MESLPKEPSLTELVKTTHPDRWREEGLTAEEEAALRRISEALTRIRQYSRKHGDLPSTWEETGVNPDGSFLFIKHQAGETTRVPIEGFETPAELVERYTRFLVRRENAEFEELPELDDATAQLDPRLFDGYEELLQNAPRERDENDEGGVSQEVVDKTVELIDILRGLLRTKEGRLTHKETKQAFDFVKLPTAPVIFAGFNRAGKVVERSISVRTEDPFPFNTLITQLQESVQNSKQ